MNGGVEQEARADLGKLRRVDAGPRESAGVETGIVMRIRKRRVRGHAPRRRVESLCHRVRAMRAEIARVEEGSVRDRLAVVHRHEHARVDAAGQTVQFARQRQAILDDVDVLLLREGLVGGLVLVHPVVKELVGKSEVGIGVVDQVAEHGEEACFEIAFECRGATSVQRVESHGPRIEKHADGHISGHTAADLQGRRLAKRRSDRPPDARLDSHTRTAECPRYAGIGPAATAGPPHRAARRNTGSKAGCRRRDFL